MLIPQAIVQEGGGGDVTRIYSETLAGTGTFDVTGISQSYTHLQVRLLVRSSRAGNTFDSVLMRVNNDSGTNYIGSGWQGTAGAFSANEKTNGTSFSGNGLSDPYFGLIPAATSPAGAVGHLICDITAYTQTTFSKPVISQWFGLLDTNGGNARVGGFGGEWQSTSAITRLTFLSGNGDAFVAGSQLTIYGIT